MSEKLVETTYGFSWGNASVERVASHNGHRIIAIVTPRGRLEVRVTPSGLIRPVTPAGEGE